MMDITGGSEDDRDGVIKGASLNIRTVMLWVLIESAYCCVSICDE